MAVRNEFLRRDARATYFGNLDLVPCASTLASRLLPSSPLAAWQIGYRVGKRTDDNLKKPDRPRVGSQAWITTGDNFGLCPEREDADA